MSFDSSDFTTISIITSDDTSTKGMTLEELRGLAKFHFWFIKGLIFVLGSIALFADPVPATTIVKTAFVFVVVMVVVFAHYMSKHEVRKFNEAIERRDKEKKS